MLNKLTNKNSLRDIYGKPEQTYGKSSVCVCPVLLTDVLSWVAVSVRSDRHMGLVQEALAAFFPGFQMQEALMDNLPWEPDPTHTWIPMQEALYTLLVE